MNIVLANHLSNQRAILLKNWFNRIRTEDTLHYQNKTDEELLPALGQIYDEIVTYLNTGDNYKINSHIQQLVGRRTQEMYVLEELLMLFSTIRRVCFEEAIKLFADSNSQLFESLNTLTDLFEKCRVKAANTYVEMQKQIIDSQHRVLELSTPVLPIDDQIIILPLIGTVDSRRANQFTEAVLNSIINYQVDIIIIDITGVSVVDTQVANHLIKTVQAANLLGAQCILVGVRPEIAQTVIRLGIEFNQLLTASNLKKGFALAKSLAKN